MQIEAGNGAKIVGTVPVCGIRFVTPGFYQPGATVDSAQTFSPDASVLRYSINSTAAEKCNTVLDTTEFNIEYRVPIEMEPQIAQDLTSKVGLTLPAVELVLPYKYKDNVSVTVDLVHDIDFTNIVYATVTSQAQIRAAKVRRELLAKEVRDLL